MISVEASVLGSADKPVKHFGSDVHSDTLVDAGSRNACHLSEFFSCLCIIRP